MTRATIRFGPFQFRAHDGCLARDGVNIPLPARAADVLRLLLERPGEVLDKEELLAGVWRTAFVADNSLTHAVSVIRHALGDDPQAPTYIQTVPRRGYRFIAPVRLPSSAQDAVSDLRGLPHGVPASGIGRSTDRRGTAVWLPWWAGIVGLLAAAWLVSTSWSTLSALREPAPGLPGSFRRLTHLPGPEYFPSLSPDGGWLVFANDSTGDLDIYLQAVGQEQALNLTSDHRGDDWMPAFSPNGQQVAFRSSRNGGGLYVMGRTGDSPRRISGEGFHPAWSPDGREIYASDDYVIDWAGRGWSSIWAVNLATGEHRTVVPAADDGVMPAVSPHGQRIAYWSVRTTGPGAQDRDVWTRGVDGQGPVAVTREPGNDWSPAWSADGRHLYFCSDRSGQMGLWRVRIDESSGAVLGEPEAMSLPSSTVVHPVVGADNRTIAFVDYTISDNLWRVGFDAQRLELVGDPEPITRGSQWFRGVDISADGAWLATTSWGRRDLVIMRADGSSSVLLTDGPVMDAFPSWAPDGSRLAFTSNRSVDGTQVFIVDRGGGHVRQVTTHTGFPQWPRFSPDGTRLLYVDTQSTPATPGARGTFLVDPDGPPEQRALILPAPAPGHYFLGHEFSPDGRFLFGDTRLLESNVVGGKRAGVGVLSLETGEYRVTHDVPPALPGWFLAVRGGWLPESRILLRIGEDLWVLDVPTLEFRLLAEGVPARALSPDRRYLYFERRERNGDIWLAELR